MSYKAEIISSSIVVLGDFNPVIFSPGWLERNKLIGEDDASLAREGLNGEGHLVSRQASKFDTEWFTLQVLENQLSLTSRGVLSPAFKDLAASIFHLVLHTPVSAVGLNFTGQFKLASQEQQHKVGDLFAPKDVWNTLYPDTCAGLGSLVIRIQEGSRADKSNSKDERRITLQPSSKLKYGVSLSINNHHDISVDKEIDLSSAERVESIIESQWEDCWSDATRVFDIVLSASERD